MWFACRPIRSAAPRSIERPLPAKRQWQVLFEDEFLLALDKPAGLAVHGGSGVPHGLIEELRATRPDARFLELVHRLDRDTSGILLIAKKRAALVALHAQLRDGGFDKRYQVLVRGRWRDESVWSSFVAPILDAGRRTSGPGRPRGSTR